MAEIRRLFFDIETSPCLGWFFKPTFNMNLGYHNVLEDAKIICICYKWGNSDKVYHLNWDKNQCDKAMIKKFVAIFDKADEVVGHNSDKFDTKWIRTRAMYHGIDMNHTYKSIDTLKEFRKGFYQPSNRLDAIGKYFNIGKKIETDNTLWLKCWRNNDKKALKKMIEYCKQDVILLEEVFNVLNPYIKSKSHVTGIKCDCPECGSDNVKLKGFYYSALGSKTQRLQCNNCNKKYQFSVKK